MSLTLEEVRTIKFRMAKRSGYEVLDVDEFVDHIEEGLAQLIEENENLKRQLSSLQTQHEHGSVDRSDQSGSNGASRPTAQTDAPEPAPVAQPSAAEQSSSAGRESIVVTTSQEASTAVVRLVQLSTEQAEKLVGEAEEDATRIRDEANRGAHQVTTDARTRAERIESEARVNADRVRSDAQGRAEQLDQETESRRHELFGGLEQQRDQLTGAVAELRQFEAQYRQNLTTHLQQQLEVVGGHRGEPDEAPALLNGRGGHAAEDRQGGADRQGGVGSDDGDDVSRGRPSGSDSLRETNGGSETPRLDALLGDH